MNVVQIFGEENESLWVRKVRMAYSFVPGFAVVIEQWEVLEHPLDVEAISAHDSYESARDFANFYLTGEVNAPFQTWEFITM